jgi:CRISPR-associated exonuclease Cas4
MNWGWIFLGLLALALAAQWMARRSRAASGLPAGRLVYADTTRWRPVERTLFSRKHRLVGRPDYLVQRRGEFIPVEVKSSTAPPDGPHAAHIFQLAAYCLLVEETHQRRPPHGLIVYAGDSHETYQVDFTPVLEEKLLTILDQMRCNLAQGRAERDHTQAARCQACGYRYACDQSLV